MRAPYAFLESVLYIFEYFHNKKERNKQQQNSYLEGVIVFVVL